MGRSSQMAGLCAAALLLAAGCGDALVSGQYQGEPLAVLEGSVVVELEQSTYAPSSAPLRVALFWVTAASGDLATLSPRAAFVEQGVDMRISLPSRYTMRIYTPPSEAVLPEGRESGLVVALILLYEDVDGDGVWDRASEPMVGGASKHLLVYADGDIEAESLGGALSAGYHLMTVEGAGGCEGAGTLERMRSPSAGERAADIVITSDLSTLMPDPDCDGEVEDWKRTIEERQAGDDDDDDGEGDDVRPEDAPDEGEPEGEPEGELEEEPEPEPEAEGR